MLGDKKEKIKDVFDKLENEKGIKINISVVSSLEEAVIKARELAKKNDIVTLSPACASFDMFPNFAVRGNVLKDIVKNLK